MSNTDTFSRLFFITALVLLVFGIFMGSMASHSYILPGFWKDSLNFTQLRALHVTSVTSWILMSATACVFFAMGKIAVKAPFRWLTSLQWALWTIALGGIFICYFRGIFGGREYWEFPAKYALLIAASWVIFLFQYIRSMRGGGPWPVYKWMWLTGICFFLVTFCEGYLWKLGFFEDSIVKDMTVQWKSNGSLVGSWNQLVYGIGIYLMCDITGDDRYAKSRISFLLFFLGLFNLMFNWGHHIYTLPTAPYVRTISYAVSMTEWIILIRMLRQWRLSLASSSLWNSTPSRRFLAASELWIFANLLLAILMSVPAINLYTHGTHITVAHSMGTTIGINTMILLAALFHFFNFDQKIPKIKVSFWIMNCSLMAFWIALIAAGIHKGVWQMEHPRASFQEMMTDLYPYFMLFTVTGSILLLSITSLVLAFFVAWLGPQKSPKNAIQ